MIYLSPTLLDSYRYYQNAEDGEEARKSLLDRLRGVEAEDKHGYMARGKEFEDDVCNLCDDLYLFKNNDANYGRCVAEAASIVRGMERQRHVEVLVAEGVKVHGYIDFLAPNEIVDTKTTQSYEFGKYRNNYQHLTYLSWGIKQGIKCFKYLILDFSKMQITVETYYHKPSYLLELGAAAREFLSYLERDKEMRDAFKIHQARYEEAK